MATKVSFILAVSLLLLPAGCDDRDVDLVDRPAVASPTATRPIAPPSAVHTQPALDESIFASSARDRDPFRCRVNEVEPPPPDEKEPDLPAKLKSYGLDELTLTGIVGGKTRPRALFRAPSGATALVQRGDWISKSFGQVKTILSDRVILQLRQKVEGTDKLGERVVRLHGRKGT